MEQMHVDMLMNREAQTVRQLVYITNVKYNWYLHWLFLCIMCEHNIL